MKLKILNTIFFIIMITFNALAVVLPINGKTTGALSDSYPNLFVPAGITFSIWSIIYLSLLIFTIYQFKDSKPKNESYLHKIGPHYIISSILNALWIVLWHYELILLSLFVMILLLLSLIKIYYSLKSWKSNLKYENFIVKQPFNIYLGWISVATVANVTTLLVDLNWNGFGISEEIWTSLIVFVILSLTLISIYKEKNYFYSLVILWAQTGILIKHFTTFDSKYTLIIGSTFISIFAIVISIFIKLYFSKYKSKTVQTT